MEFPIQLIRIAQAPLKGSKSKFQLDFPGGVFVFKRSAWDHKIVDGGRGLQRPPKIYDRQNFGEAKYQVDMKKQHLMHQSK